MDIQLDDIPIDFEHPEESTSQLTNFDVDSNGSDSELDQETSSETKKKNRRRTYSKLSPHLKGLMGEANLRYARGDIETAKKMCFEVIRQAPDAYEPFITLAQMYENSNITKYRGYLMLATHLYSMNASIWCRLAEANVQAGFLMEAVSCYSKALKVEPLNMEIHQKRIELLEKKGDSKTIWACRLRMANKMPEKQYEAILKICTDCAKQYFKQKNYIRAIEALEILFKRFPNNVTQDILNMMLELLLHSQRYTDCLDYFTQFCGFTFDIFINPDNSVVVNSYVIPDNLQVDLKMKFIICLIRLKSDHLMSDLINSILIEDDVETVGDLYLDVVEALMSSNYQKEALKLLVPLVKSKNYSLAGVWLKYAECLNSCEMYEQAVDAYFTVMALAPLHVEVLYPLAMLLLKLNKKQEALDVLSQDLVGNKCDVAVLIEKMKLLKQINDLDSYWKSVELLLSRHCIVMKYPDELKFVLTRETYREKLGKFIKIRLFRSDNDEVETNLTCIREPTVEEEYQLFLEVLQFAKDKRCFMEMQKFAFMGMCSKRFQKHFDDISFLSFIASIENRDFFHGYPVIRDILTHHTDNNLAWNWFNLILQSPDEIRHIRFLERYFDTQPAAAMIEANYHLAVGNYAPALVYYMKEFKNQKSSFVALMISITMLQMYQQKTLEKNKRKAVAETVSYLFLNYVKCRSKFAKHEAFYNLGRMYHQIGVTYLAEFYYKKCLKIHNGFIEYYPDILDLKREAAFNLHVIYRNSGNLTAARKILMDYIVI